ncbi:MAG TPA: hypothetical protein VI011_15450, partial [Asanoa sp.]
WDPVAAVALTTPSVVTVRTAPFLVTPDGRTAERPSGTPVAVTTRADPAAVARAMLDAYGRGDATAGALFKPGAATVEVVGEIGTFRMHGPGTLAPGDTTIRFDASHGPGFVALVGRLTGGHRYAEVEAAVAAGVTRVPPWFTLEATAEVPAGSAPTWVVDLPAGEHAVVAGNPDGTAVTALGLLAVR